MKFLASFLLGLTLVSCGQENTTEQAATAGNARIDSLLKAGKVAEQTDYDKAATLYVRSLRLSRERQYEKGLFSAYRYLVFNRGILKGNFGDGLKWSDEGIAQAQRTDIARFTGDVYAMRATLHHAHSRLDTAAHYYKKAIDILEPENNKEDLTPIYNNIAGLHNLLGNYHLARQYMQQYIGIKEQEKDTAALIGAYSNMYIFIAALRDTLKAEKYLHKAKQLLAFMPQNDAAPMVYSNLGESYQYKKQYDSVAYYSNLRLRYALPRKDTLSILKAYNTLILAQLGLTQLPKAGASLQAMQQYARPFDTPIYQSRDIAQLMYQYNKKAGHLSTAFAALENYNDLYDKIRRMEISKDLEQFEQEREQNKQEKNLLNKQLQISQKNTAIVLLSAVLLLLIVAGGLVVTWYRKRQALQQEHIAFLEKEKEWNRSKSLLEGQLNERNRISRELHDDLGASLTSIALASRLVQNKPGHQYQEEMAIISSSATEMVQTLNEIVWTLNSRNDSLQSLVAYIHKFAGNFLDNANIQLQSTDNLPIDDVVVGSHIRRAIYLTAKEAFNNIVKHSQASFVQMTVDYNQDVLTFLIRDNGIGFTNGTSAGNGLLNMQKNMTMIDGSCLVDQQNGVLMTIRCRLTTT